MKRDNLIEVYSDKISLVELANASEPISRAIVTIPLMHVGSNNKHLKWTPEVLRNIAPSFRGVTFKYDIEGKEGSSHVPNKLSSPFYDVGWTYDNEDGAWFDGSTLWVKGEVTHPEVLSKLQRTTTDGKREINYGSMGVFIDPNMAHCSICGAKPFGSCEHERGKQYGSEICNLVPEGIEKALHVALTNDPADTEADITNVLFQEAGMEDMATQEPDHNAIIKALAEKSKMMEERLKALEETNGGMSEMDKPEEKKLPPEAIEQKETAEDKDMEEEEKMESSEAAKTVTCPKCGHQFSAETAESNSEAPAPKDKSAEQAVSEGSADKVSPASEENEGNKVNKAAMDKPSEFADVYANKYKKKLLVEVADMATRLGKFRSKEVAMKEFADRSIEQLETMNDLMSGMKPANAHFASNDVPEFGAPEQKGNLEVADMGAAKRAESFGDFGKWEVCFRPQNASQFRK